MKSVFIKISIIYCFMLCGGLLQSQVVQISNISSNIRMQIDPLSNSSGTSGISDDLVITQDGSVGFGTIAPRAKVEVNGKLRIVDGNQQAGAFFVSDATGLGSWYDADLIGRKVLLGTVMSAANLSSSYTNITSAPITLKGGLWMIVGRADIVGGGTGSEERPQFVWLKIEERTTDTNSVVTTKTISEAGSPHMIRLGVYTQYYCTPMVMGFVSVPIEGALQKTRQYYIYAKSPSTTYTSPRLTANLSGAYFYAIKLQ